MLVLNIEQRRRKRAVAISTYASLKPLTAASRVSNILKSQEVSYTIDNELLTEDCEVRLWEAYNSVKDKMKELTRSGDYYDALTLIAGLRKPVDEFFDGVEVLTKDSLRLKKNRLAILHNVARLFMGLADFSRFSI